MKRWMVRIGLFAVALVAVLAGTAGCAVRTDEGGGWATRDALGRGMKSSPLPPPVPTDIRLVPPGPDLPKELRAFSGAWANGCWGDDNRWWVAGDPKGDRRCHLLVVEEILSPEKADVVFSNGESYALQDWRPVRSAVWRREVGVFKDGALVVYIEGSRAVYRMGPDGTTLSGELEEPGSVLKATFKKLNIAAPPAPQTGRNAN